MGDFDSPLLLTRLEMKLKELPRRCDSYKVFFKLDLEPEEQEKILSDPGRFLLEIDRIEDSREWGWITVYLK